MHKSQGKLKVLYYIIGAIILISLGLVVSHEFPMTPEHIEEVIQ